MHTPWVQRASLGALLGGIVLVAAAYVLALAGPGRLTVATWSIVVGQALVSSGGMALGAQRYGRLSPLALVAILGIPLSAAVCFGVALSALQGAPAVEPMVWGLPRRAALVVYGVGVLPLFLLPLVYALTFERWTLSEADIRRMREVTISPRV